MHSQINNNLHKLSTLRIQQTWLFWKGLSKTKMISPGGVEGGRGGSGNVALGKILKMRYPNCH